MNIGTFFLPLGVGLEQARHSALLVLHVSHLQKDVTPVSFEAKCKFDTSGFMYSSFSAAPADKSG